MNLTNFKPALTVLFVRKWAALKMFVSSVCLKPLNLAFSYDSFLREVTQAIATILEIDVAIRFLLYRFISVVKEVKIPFTKLWNRRPNRLICTRIITAWFPGSWHLQCWKWRWQLESFKLKGLFHPSIVTANWIPRWRCSRILQRTDSTEMTHQNQTKSHVNNFI